MEGHSVKIIELELTLYTSQVTRTIGKRHYWILRQLKIQTSNSRVESKYVDVQIVEIVLTLQ